MTVEIGYDEDEIADGAGNIEAQADALESAASAAEEAVAPSGDAATSFQDTYEPDGIHAAKVSEMEALLTARAAYARATADRLRSLAQAMRNAAQEMAETQSAHVAETDGIEGDI